MIHDAVKRSVNLSKRRVTDLADNSRIYLPKALSALNEARIAIRMDEYRQQYEDYKKKHCNKKGDQKCNMTERQKRGLDSLSKRVAKGSI